MKSLFGHPVSKYWVRLCEEDEDVEDDDDEVEFHDKLAITYFHSRVTEYHSMSINASTIQATMHLKVN